MSAVVSILTIFMNLIFLQSISPIVLSAITLKSVKFIYLVKNKSKILAYDLN